MAYGETARKRIENGRCITCGVERVVGRVKCDTCIRLERIQFRQRSLAEMATDARMRRRLAQLWEYLGVEASPGQVKSAYELEQGDKVRWIFFCWLFDSRKKNTLRDFGDYDKQKQSFGNARKELITDSLEYAAIVSDPLSEIREWTQERAVETCGRSPLAIAMAGVRA